MARLSDRIGPIGETSGVRRFRLAGACASLRVSTGPEVLMEAFLVSTLLVALAEMGDRTQLLTVMLASRYRRPIPILWGVLVAALAANVLAALAGFFLSGLLSAAWFHYAVSASFILMAVWAMVPEKGVFLTTAVTFFIAEIGDKTQVAAAALAARFHDVLIVTAGTTLGMMLANIPAIWLGHRITRVLPIGALKLAAALVYLGLGLWGIAETAGWIRS
jgi:putative Ca2+/H+ antiporter (TMEM165/GDT1 family)